MTSDKPAPFPFREMRGRRVAWPDDAYPVEVVNTLKAGEYAGPWRGRWFACAPSGEIGTIDPAMHTVEEHEDGTISVQPSLDYHLTGGMVRRTDKPNDNAVSGNFDALNFGTGRHNWHGWLKRGIWSAA